MSQVDSSVLEEVSFIGKGITSRKQITVAVSRQAPGHGIVFEVTAQSETQPVKIPAKVQFVVNTLRNVTLGIGQVRLCIVEHFLAAAALYGLDDLLVKIDGPELPLGDGSGSFWFDLFQKAGWQRVAVSAVNELSSQIVLKRGDRLLLAIPDDQFSVSYMMDWNHPAIGKQWQQWTAQQDPRDIADARTFGSQKEHEMLGIADEVVSLTPEGFSQPLRFADEPVRHKLFDLVGDLVLAGVNPLSWKAKFISIKGGHELDVEMAKELISKLNR